MKGNLFLAAISGLIAGVSLPFGSGTVTRTSAPPRGKAKPKKAPAGTKLAKLARMAEEGRLGVRKGW